jgi:hypothetical protein
MHAIASPNASFPPGDEALALADVVLPSISDLTVDAVASLDPD